jgi:hypothetical protein
MQSLIIIEDDIEIAPDFFSYFDAMEGEKKKKKKKFCFFEFFFCFFYKDFF